jgi:RNA polymerase sigma factor (sigma-70 family)
MTCDQTKSALRRHRREGTLVDPAALNDIVHVAACVSIRACGDDMSSASTPTAEHRHLRIVLRQAVKRLPANQRVVIRAYLTTSDGIVDYRTLAKRLRVSIETVRRYLRRGKERLRLLCRDIERERERDRKSDLIVSLLERSLSALVIYLGEGMIRSRKDA